MKMNAKALLLVVASAALMVSAGAATAQTAPLPATVTLKGSVSQPSLRDDKMRDTFTIELLDAAIVASIESNCQAGRMNFGLLRQDEACAITGTGSLVNPANPAQTIARTQYGGGFTITKTGYTDLASLQANYLQVRSVPGGMVPFGGSASMTPELPSNGALAIFESIKAKLPEGEPGQSELINDNMDSIGFAKMFVPSAGWNTDQGCYWTGDMIFAYASDTWFIDLKAECTEVVDGAPKTTAYEFKGNMPWISSPGKDNQTQYDVTLALPSAAITSDDAFFGNASADADFFAAAAGISGTIVMAESGYVDVEMDGQVESLPTQIDITGSLTGTDVPLNVVRSFATIIATFPRTFFGA